MTTLENLMADKELGLEEKIPSPNWFEVEGQFTADTNTLQSIFISTTPESNYPPTTPAPMTPRPSRSDSPVEFEITQPNAHDNTCVNLKQSELEIVQQFIKEAEEIHIPENTTTTYNRKPGILLESPTSNPIISDSHKPLNNRFTKQKPVITSRIIIRKTKPNPNKKSKNIKRVYETGDDILVSPTTQFAITSKYKHLESAQIFETYGILNQYPNAAGIHTKDDPLSPTKENDELFIKAAEWISINKQSENHDINLLFTYLGSGYTCDTYTINTSPQVGKLDDYIKAFHDFTQYINTSIDYHCIKPSEIINSLDNYAIKIYKKTSSRKIAIDHIITQLEFLQFVHEILANIRVLKTKFLNFSFFDQDKVEQHAVVGIQEKIKKMNFASEKIKNSSEEELKKLLEETINFAENAHKFNTNNMNFFKPNAEPNPLNKELIQELKSKPETSPANLINLLTWRTPDPDRHILIPYDSHYSLESKAKHYNSSPKPFETKSQGFYLALDLTPRNIAFHNNDYVLIDFIPTLFEINGKLTDSHNFFLPETELKKNPHIQTLFESLYHPFATIGLLLSKIFIAESTNLYVPNFLNKQDPDIYIECLKTHCREKQKQKQTKYHKALQVLIEKDWLNAEIRKFVHHISRQSYNYSVDYLSPEIYKQQILLIHSLANYPLEQINGIYYNIPTDKINFWRTTTAAYLDNNKNIRLIRKGSVYSRNNPEKTKTESIPINPETLDRLVANLDNETVNDSDTFDLTDDIEIAEIIEVELIELKKTVGLFSGQEITLETKHPTRQMTKELSQAIPITVEEIYDDQSESQLRMSNTVNNNILSPKKMTLLTDYIDNYLAKHSLRLARSSSDICLRPRPGHQTISRALGKADFNHLKSDIMYTSYYKEQTKDIKYFLSNLDYNSQRLKFPSFSHQNISTLISLTSATIDSVRERYESLYEEPIFELVIFDFTQSLLDPERDSPEFSHYKVANRRTYEIIRSNGSIHDFHKVPDSKKAYVAYVKIPPSQKLFNSEYIRKLSDIDLYFQIEDLIKEEENQSNEDICKPVVLTEAERTKTDDHEGNDASDSSFSDMQVPDNKSTLTTSNLDPILYWQGLAAVTNGPVPTACSALPPSPTKSSFKKGNKAHKPKKVKFIDSDTSRYEQEEPTLLPQPHFPDYLFEGLAATLQKNEQQRALFLYHSQIFLTHAKQTLQLNDNVCNTLGFSTKKLISFIAPFLTKNSKMKKIILCFINSLATIEESKNDIKTAKSSIRKISCLLKNKETTTLDILKESFLQLDKIQNHFLLSQLSDLLLELANEKTEATTTQDIKLLLYLLTGFKIATYKRSGYLETSQHEIMAKKLSEFEYFSTIHEIDQFIDHILVPVFRDHLQTSVMIDIDLLLDKSSFRIYIANCESCSFKICSKSFAFLGFSQPDDNHFYTETNHHKPSYQISNQYRGGIANYYLPKKIKPIDLRYIDDNEIDDTDNCNTWQLKCCYCDYPGTAKSCLKHKAQHTALKVCNICKTHAKFCNFPNHNIDHQEYVNASQDKKPIHCAICGTYFSSPNKHVKLFLYKLHKNSHPSQSVTKCTSYFSNNGMKLKIKKSPSSIKAKCGFDECNNRYTLSTLRKHIMRDHYKL